MPRLAYADTSRGQVHFRHAGSGETFVLLHWAPGSSAQYDAILAGLAASGFRGIAPDLPGFGSSFRREGHWTIGDFAQNVIEVLDALQLNRCVLVGGHLSALITMEVALRAPDRLIYVGLDGTPLWTPQKREHVVREDGSHLVKLWQETLAEARMWRPHAAFDAEFGAFVTRILRARFLADFDMRPANALLEYDALAAADRLAVPVLALTAEDDTLRGCHEDMMRRVRDVTGHVFANDHPVHRADGGALYAEALIAHLQKITSRR